MFGHLADVGAELCCACKNVDVLSNVSTAINKGIALNGAPRNFVYVLLASQMSALGQKQTFAIQKVMSALPRKRTCAVQLRISAKGHLLP